MAIGKLNAYATVEAPKADFGAVAQLNIDNLVKSAKEDEQLKAAKAAAEDKAKQERVKDLGIFPDMTATGATGADSSNIRQASEGLKMWNEYNRDWVENGNYDSKAKAAALINHYKNLNNQMSELQKGAANFGTLAGQDKVNSKDKAYTMDLLKSSESGLIQFGFDKDTNPKVGIYKMSEDGTTKEFVKSIDYNEYYKNIWTPVANIDISEKANDAKNSFEKSLTEKFPGLIKTGIKELSKDAKDSIYKMALSEVENDQFMYVAGDKYNVIAKDDYKKSGFDVKDKEKVARAYADEIIGKFGKDVEITKIQPASQPKGDGKAVKGQANVAIDSPFKLIKPNEIRGYTTGANDPTKMASVPVGSLSFPINASGMDKPEMMDSSTGGKTGAIITPNSFYVSPDGNLYLTASSKSSEQIKAEGGVYSGAENVEGNNYVFSYRTNGTEFANAAKGILNTQPTWTLDNGKEVKIRTTKDIVNYFDQLEKLRGGNGLSLRNIKVGTPSSSPAKVNSSSKTNYKKPW